MNKQFMSQFFDNRFRQLSHDMFTWSRISFSLNSLGKGISTKYENKEFSFPINFNFEEFINSLNPLVVSSRVSNERILYFEKGVVSVQRNNLIKTMIFGENQWVDDFVSKLNKHHSLSSDPSMIEWAYLTKSGSMMISSVQMEKQQVYQSFYPWINKPLTQYFDDFYNNSACILLLIGPPGTGKTSFIRNMLFHCKSNALLTYDPVLMADDNLFIHYIQDQDTNFLIMEDSDIALSAREDGNTVMQKFLNVSNGLVSATHKKIVFSTNLPNVRSVDPALLRPGRCYDIVEFRSLDRFEAEKALFDIDPEKQLPDGEQFTLAELFNQKASLKSIQNKVGFI